AFATGGLSQDALLLALVDEGGEALIQVDTRTRAIVCDEREISGIGNDSASVDAKRTHRLLEYRDIVLSCPCLVFPQAQRLPVLLNEDDPILDVEVFEEVVPDAGTKESAALGESGAGVAHVVEHLEGLDFYPVRRLFGREETRKLRQRII